METIDFRKDPIYKAPKDPEIITVPNMLFVAVDGEGAPDSSDNASTDFQIAMQVIFGVVYTIKFWDKKYTPPKGYKKFTNAPIEALWWTKDGTEFDLSTPDNWAWRAMLRVPDFVTPQYFTEVVSDCIARKQSYIYSKAQRVEFDEGECVQMMHIGPYNEEGPNILRMHAYAKDLGYKLRGRHHELYFGDPRRTKPEKLKTILRQPISKD
ncbi:MAG: GyrI-like domain-containing protein [Candidatus Saccharimonadales bacterium]